ncbi:MAG: class 1 isoprenoid biosynthesis enzyme [Candidatus Moduliflexus flocculans]|nr:class 1 isoprenoid biosynthesis enzyme [Candidatus Moduliflexus flocculans]
MSGITSSLSTRVGPLGGRVEELVRRHTELWREAPAEPRPPKKRYTRADKRAVEGELSALVGRLSAADVRTAFLDGSLDAAGLEAVAAGLKPGFKRLLGLIELPLDAVYDARFIDSTRRFLRTARDFDPGLGLDSAYQALRNVWIMNSLQFDLGLPVAHGDAVFAYSMVYPYLDNVLDDAGTSESGKLALLAKLREWLEGTGPEAASPGEARLLSLVRLIEGCLPRPRFPGVYGSLLAIYNAQVKSLLQQKPGALTSPDDVLAISLEKGGTSVLADGYLVAGDLSAADEEFCFGFGTFLQLADDLQDIAEDSRCGLRTLFTDAAGRAGREGRRGPARELSRRRDRAGPERSDAGAVGALRRHRRRTGAHVQGLRGKTPRAVPEAARAVGQARLPRPIFLSREAPQAARRRNARGRNPPGRSRPGAGRPHGPVLAGLRPRLSPGRAAYLAMTATVFGSRTAFQTTAAALASPAGRTVPVISSPRTLPS